jgi:hypothetical protein
LSEEKQADPELFHYNNRHDLKYQGMNVAIILAFFATKKTKTNRKTTLFSHIQKYHDAILFRAAKVKERLPTSYFNEMEKFLKGFKKECATAKSEGNLDKREGGWPPFMGPLPHHSELVSVEEQYFHLGIFTSSMGLHG